VKEEEEADQDVTSQDKAEEKEDDAAVDGAA